MKRRGFLRGMLVALGAGVATASTRGTALVKLATPAEAQALTVGQPVRLGQPPAYDMPSLNDGNGEVYMRRLDGGFVAIGYITEFRVSREMLETHSWNGEIQYVPGLMRGRIFFEGQR